MKKFTFDLQHFAIGTTTTTEMVIPKVWADMINASIAKAIKFTPFAKVDSTLVGQPGDTVVIPSWKYIGPAIDVAEGADIDLTQMATATKEMTIKKAAKGIEITDEAVLRGMGDPLGQGQYQLALSIADKLEEDVIAALGGATLIHNATAKITYDDIVDAVDKLGEESNTEKVLFIHSKQITALRKDPNFVDQTKYGGQVMMTGEIGQVSGCRIVVSNRVPLDNGEFSNYIVCLSAVGTDPTPVLPAVTVFMKRDTAVETDRDIVAKKTVVTADKHYGVALTNEAKVVKLVTKE